MTPRWLGVLLALAACAPAPPRKIALDSSWAPLVAIIRADGVRPGWVSTAVPYVYAQDPRILFDGSVDADAALTHERLHATRQLDAGLGAWQILYMEDAKFRTDEELLGWHVQILYLVKHGHVPDPTWVATSLVSYDPPLQLSFEWSLAWAGAEVTAAR